MKMSVIAKVPGFLAAAALLALLLAPGPPSWGAAKQWKDVPGTVVIDEIPPVARVVAWQDKFGPVTFNHKMHTGFTRCETCHHTHRNTAYGLCDNCHTQVPGLFVASATHMFMGCKYCHGGYSPAKPWMPSLKTALHKTCFGCHVGIGELGVSPAGCAQTCHTGEAGHMGKKAGHMGGKTEKAGQIRQAAPKL
ncbi:MAG: cytochrome c3 family protein [Nitrospiraceae bacterium]|nr:cytochrome c3 family protein [Nitrospiraceae bacterium]